MILTPARIGRPWRRAAERCAAAALVVAVTLAASPSPARAAASGTTVAGISGTTGSDRTHLYVPEGVAFDSQGDMFVADTANQRVQEYLPGGSSYSAAGATIAGVTGVSGSDAVHLSNPAGIAFDGAGDLFVADTGNNRVQEYALTGSGYAASATTVAGSAITSGSDPAHLYAPTALALDGTSDLFVVDSGNNRVQEFTFSAGAYSASATTVAGNASGAPGVDASHLASPFGISIDLSGDLFVVDYGNNRVEEAVRSGSSYLASMTTVAGDPGGRYGADATHLFLPEGATLDPAGNLYVTDGGNNRVIKVAYNGTSFASAATTVAGVTGQSGSDAAHLATPYGLAIDAAGDLTVADGQNDRVQEFAASGSGFASNANTAAGITGNHGADPVHLNGPRDAITDATGNLFVADTQNDRVLEYAPSGLGYGVMPTVVAGVSAAPGSDATHLNQPSGIALDPAGDLVIADSGNHRVQEYTISGSAFSATGTTVAGTSGVSGADSTHLDYPEAVAFDGSGDLIIADSANHRVEKYAVSGTGFAAAGTTVAGVSGTAGNDLGHLNFPSGVAVDSHGTLVVADTNNDRVVAFTPNGTGWVSPGTVIVGVTGVTGTDMGHLSAPKALAVDTVNDLFVSDSGNSRVQELPTTGPGMFGNHPITVAGDGGLSGIDASHLNANAGVYVDGSNNMFVADTGNNRIQRFAVTFPTPPSINVFRSVGSRTDFSALARIGDLYTQSSIFGCTLSTDNRTCDMTLDTPYTDTVDDYGRNEYVNGGPIGTTTGIAQLCGTAPAGDQPTPDFVRAGRAPLAGECGSYLTYGADGVAGLDFPFTNSATISCSCTATQIGPVAAGWRPGDPYAGPYSGVGVTNLSDVGTSGTVGSVAERIFCETGANRISDWGQLTDPTADPANPGATKGADGVGAPIGAPIVIPLIDPTSDSYASWATFVGCANPTVNNGDGRPAPADNAAALTFIAAKDNPTDAIAAANQVAAAMTFIGYGLSVASPYTTNGGTRTRLNGIAASQTNESPAAATPFPTRHPLNLVYDPNALRGSTAAFLNWVCDTDPFGQRHGLDGATGIPYTGEITNTLSTAFWMPRVPCAVDGHGSSIPPIRAYQVVYPTT